MSCDLALKLSHQLQSPFHSTGTPGHVKKVGNWFYIVCCNVIYVLGPPALALIASSRYLASRLQQGM